MTSQNPEVQHVSPIDLWMFTIFQELTKLQISFSVAAVVVDIWYQSTPRSRVVWLPNAHEQTLLFDDCMDIHMDTLSSILEFVTIYISSYGVLQKWTCVWFLGYQCGYVCPVTNRRGPFTYVSWKEVCPMCLLVDQPLFIAHYMILYFGYWVKHFLTSFLIFLNDWIAGESTGMFPVFEFPSF